jgi:hypothetical protein
LQFVQRSFRMSRCRIGRGWCWRTCSATKAGLRAPHRRRPARFYPFYTVLGCECLMDLCDFMLL